VEVERIELSSEGRQRRTLHTYLLPFVSPDATVEATKHRIGLARFGLFLGTSEQWVPWSSPLNDALSNHAGDVWKSVAALSSQC